jgi:hypothetical protein
MFSHWRKAGCHVTATEAASIPASYSGAGFYVVVYLSKARTFEVKEDSFPDLVVHTPNQFKLLSYTNALPAKNGAFNSAGNACVAQLLPR